MSSVRISWLKIKKQLTQIANSRWFGWACLFAILLKILWGIWDKKDFPGGDTLNYYDSARVWHEQLLVSPCWSPLYTAYLGSFLWLNPDPYFAMWAHRIGILVAIVFLLYEITRRLTTPLLAFLIVAWWVVVPTNHDQLYEVHPFAIILPLGAILLLCRGDSLWHRSTAIGLFLIATFLARPEYLVPTVLIMLSTLLWDLAFKPDGRVLFSKLQSFAFPFGLPILLAGAMIAAFFSRSTIPLQDLDDAIHAKQKQNVNQLFAFGYMKRNPTWTKNPWTSADELMIEQFGTDDISLTRAWQIKPSVMLEHLLWNWRMLPEGIAIGLFSASYGNLNPDYVKNQRRPLFVGVAGAFLMMTTCIGFLTIQRRRRNEWYVWLNERLWPILGLICLCVGSLSILLLAPPRPAFIYGLTISLMIFVGIGLHGLFSLWEKREKYVFITPLFMLIFVGLVPRYWADKPRNQPILTQVTALLPLREAIAKGEIKKVAVSQHPDAVRAYLNLDAKLNDSFVSSYDIQTNPNQKLSDALRIKGIDTYLVYVGLKNRKFVNQFEKKARFYQWKKVRDLSVNRQRVRIYRDTLATESTTNRTQK